MKELLQKIIYQIKVAYEWLALKLKYSPPLRLYRRVASRVRLFFIYLGFFLKAVFKNDYLMVVEDIGPWADEDRTLLFGSFQLLLQVLEGNALKSFWGTNWERKNKGEKKLPDSEFYKNKDKYIREHLDWAITLDSPDIEEHLRCEHMAVDARIAKELYEWWTVTRPNRPDPDSLIDYTGLPDISELENWSEYFRVTQDNEVHSQQVKASMDLETAHYEEDNTMLRKLASIRRSLWA